MNGYSPEERFLSRRQQCERYGVNVRTIVRWGEDPDLGFPAEIDICGHKYRRLSDLENWERGRAVRASSSRARAIPARQA